AEIALKGAWSHAAFEAQRARIERQLAAGQLREALGGARALLQPAQAAGAMAYDDADYDLAIAHILLGRGLKKVGVAEQALPLLDEARQRFGAIAREQNNRIAESMASKCLSERGDCLQDLGRLDEAAAAYEERIRTAEELGDERGVS